MIVLVDGLFYGQFSVWHKEILCALDCGIDVIGASSMGALRAAELQGTGMTGIGTIFDWYRDGFIDGDDEVALIHQSEEGNFLGLTMPLVNLRWNLSRAVTAGIIDDRGEALIVETAKCLCFSDRRLEKILASLVDQMEIAPIQAWLEHAAEDLKKLDCIQALQFAAQRDSAQHTPQAVRLRAYEYFHWNVGIQYFTQERLTSIKAKTASGETPLADYYAKISVEDIGYRELLKARAFQRLIVGWANELRLEAEADHGGTDAARTWDPEVLGHDHRLASGLTLIDIAREKRDATFCSALQDRFCDVKFQDVIAVIDQKLAQNARLSPIAWQRMIALNGRLIYTLWRLGREKNIYIDGRKKDQLTHALESPNALAAAEMIMAYADWVFATGPSMFGYLFDPAREILLAYQYLNEIELIDLRVAA